MKLEHFFILINNVKLSRFSFDGKGSGVLRYVSMVRRNTGHLNVNVKSVYGNAIFDLFRLFNIIQAL